MKIFQGLMLLLVLAPLSLAAEFSINNLLHDEQSIRSFGLAGAYTAVAEGVGANMQNPAGLGFPGSGLAIEYFDTDNSNLSQQKNTSFYASPFGYSLSYIRDKSGNNARVHRVGLGFAEANGFSWGINYKAIDAEIDGQLTQGWSSDLGFLLRVYPWLSAGAVIKDLHKNDVDVARSVSLGLSGYHDNQATLWSLQTDYNENGQDKFSTSFGTEFYLSPRFSLRSGFKKEQVYIGSSMFMPFFNLNLGMSTEIGEADNSEYVWSIDFGRGSVSEQYRKKNSLYPEAKFVELYVGSNLVTGKSEFSIFGGQKIGSNDLLHIIHALNEDESCEGYIIRIGNLYSSLVSVALIQEIREELIKAKETGKRIIVYIESSAQLSEYYLASVADTIVMTPMGSIEQFGLKIEVDKVSGFLDKLGIEQTIINSGEHKAATRASSPALNYVSRKQLTALIERLFEDVQDDIKDSREQSQDSLSFITDGKLITAKRALELNLVDHLAYFPDVYELLELEKDDVMPLMEFLMVSEHSSLKSRKSFIPLRNRIAVVEVDGGIGLGDNSMNILFGGHSTGAEEFDRIVDLILEDATIRGVVLRINSPGGGIVAADRMYEAVKRLRLAGVAVYSSMGNMATSAGYYIALNSHKIYANKSTITGSVGVISGLTSFAGLKEALGIENEKIMTGKYMDLYSSNTSLSDEQKAVLQQHQDNFYQEFVEKVKQNRSLSDKEAYTFSQGQIVSGETAVTAHLIDEVGGFYRVIDDLAKDLGIEDPDVFFARTEAKLGFPFQALNQAGLSILKSQIKGLNSEKSRY